MTTPAVDTVDTTTPTGLPSEAQALPESDSNEECGAFFVNLFGAVHHAINQF